MILLWGFCQSICRVVVLCLNECALHQIFFSAWWGHHSSFFSPKEHCKIPTTWPSRQS